MGVLSTLPLTFLIGGGGGGGGGAFLLSDIITSD